jgi:hypothetical protein
MKLIMMVRPNPAMTAKMISAAAAPSPDTKPDIYPRFNVRCIHSTPMGPSGADTSNPINTPFMKISGIMVFGSGC